MLKGNLPEDVTLIYTKMYEDMDKEMEEIVKEANTLQPGSGNSIFKMAQKVITDMEKKKPAGAAADTNKPPAGGVAGPNRPPSKQELFGNILAQAIEKTPKGETPKIKLEKDDNSPMVPLKVKKKDSDEEKTVLVSVAFLQKIGIQPQPQPQPKK